MTIAKFDIVETFVLVTRLVGFHVAEVCADCGLLDEELEAVVLSALVAFDACVVIEGLVIVASSS